MRRIAIFLGFAVVVIAWIIIDSDKNAQDRLAALWNNVTGFVTGSQEPPPPPNWGDVAAKVGEFAEQERALRDTLNATGGQSPAPAAP